MPTRITAAVEKRLLTAHNRRRAAAGLPPLAANAALHGAAQEHAVWMASRRTVTHVEDPGPSEQFTSRIAAHGHAGGNCGENLALGFADVPAVMAGWEADAGHLANILNADYKDVGFAVVEGGDGQNYWCVTFAAR